MRWWGLGYGGAERVGVFCGKMRGGRLLGVMAVGLAVVGGLGYGGAEPRQVKSAEKTVGRAMNG